MTEDAGGGQMRGAGFAINGMRAASTSILLDGSENVDTFTASVGQTIPLDSVQEFSVLTNNFTAEYGRASGGVVNLVTKSGTNTFHGSAYEYNRVSALSSNTFQNDETDTPKGVFTRNDFGFAIGGPIKKDKLFFFNNTEWVRVRSSAPTNYTIIDPASVASLAPASQAFFNAYGKLASDVRTIASGPCSATVANSPTCDTVGFSVPSDAGGGSPQNTWMEVARFDYNFSPNTSLFFRYAAFNELDFPGTVVASPYAGYNTGQTNFDQNYEVSLVHFFTPSLVNTAKATYNRLNGPVQGLGTNPVGPTLYNSATSLPNVTVNGNSFPLVYPGYSETTPGNAIPFGGPQNLYQFHDDLSWSHGKHQFKFGGQFIQLRDNRVFGAYENSVEALGTNLNTALANLVSGNIYQFQGAVYPQGKYPCIKDATGHLSGNRRLYADAAGDTTSVQPQLPLQRRGSLCPGFLEDHTPLDTHPRSPLGVLRRTAQCQSQRSIPTSFLVLELMSTNRFATEVFNSPKTAGCSGSQTTKTLVLGLALHGTSWETAKPLSAEVMG